MRAMLPVALVLMAATAGAQAPGGTPPPPNPLGNPLLESPDRVKEEAFYEVPLLPEDRRYLDIDGTKMKAVVREAAAISRRDQARGTLFWGRNVGFQGHAETQDWVEGYFRRFGLENVHRKSFRPGPAVDGEVVRHFVLGRRHALRPEDRPAGRGRAVHPRRRGGVRSRLGQHRNRRRLRRTRRQGEGRAHSEHPAARACSAIRSRPSARCSAPSTPAPRPSA